MEYEGGRMMNQCFVRNSNDCNVMNRKFFLPILMLAAAVAGGHAAPVPAPAVESVTQTWQVGDGVLRARAEMVVSMRDGQTLGVLSGRMSLTGFESDGLRVVAGGGARDGDAAPEILVVATRDGRHRASFEYEARLPDGAVTVTLPTPAAAVQRLRVVFSRAGWEAAADPVVERVTGADGATDFVLPPGAVKVSLRPQTRDLDAEEARFFVESADLFLPAPGIVNGLHRLTVRPTQGRVAEMRVLVAEGFTVGRVEGAELSHWRFDPEARMLAMEFAPAPSGVFEVRIGTQRATGRLPYEVKLEPLVVEGAAGQVGLTATAFSGDAQPDQATPTGMTPVDAADFDAAMIPGGAERPQATLHQVFRHSGRGASLLLGVLGVEPEVRVTSSQVLSLGEERVVLASDLTVEITRAGIFRLAFDLPPGFDLESASGDALTHWTEAAPAEAGGPRVITLHLAGRTMGTQQFALQMAAPFPGALENWQVPGVVLRGVPRQTGTLSLVPERGVRLRVVDREQAVQAAAPDALAARPGVLSFRLLQPDWRLALAIERLEAWTTAEALEEVFVRDGQSTSRLALRLRIENAAIRTFRLRLPGLDEEDARTVRAGGDAVADFVRVPAEGGGSGDVWELRFQRGMLGETSADVHFQRRHPANDSFESFQVEPVVLADARQSSHFVALRAGGRLELDPGSLPRGWQRTDWQSVPAHLHDPTNPGVPAHVFRAVDPEAPLAVAVRRQSIADTIKLGVRRARFATALSPDGNAVTSAQLDVRLAEKTTLRLTLPANAALLALTVDGQPTALAREGDALLFHLLPGPVADSPVAVAFSYTTGGGKDGRAALAAPALDVPMEDVEWRVTLPDGFRLARHDGSLILQEEENRWFSKGTRESAVDSYLGTVAGRREEEAERGKQVLEEGNRLLAEGKADQALAAFNVAVGNAGLDSASNEDARVQLRNIQTQQAVLGLNTRRQRMVLDQGDAGQRAQAEQAARENPLLLQPQFRPEGQRTAVDARQLARLLQGNTMEESGALQRMADRMITQQETTTTALRSLALTLPDDGRTLVFSRAVQVDGSAPLQLDLRFKPERSRGALPGLVFLAALGGVLFLLTLLARRFSAA